MKIVNILDWIEDENVREEDIRSILSDFSCSINPEVDDFIHEKAIDFAKRKTAITYLLYNEDNNLSGFFAVTHKSITIQESFLNKREQKKLKQYAVLEDGKYVVSAFLVAQLSRNFQASDKHIVGGAELLRCCIEVIKKIQHMVGGRIIILECEKNNLKLEEFYRQNSFHDYDSRVDKDGNEYRVFLRLL